MGRRVGVEEAEMAVENGMLVGYLFMNYSANVI